MTISLTCTALYLTGSCGPNNYCLARTRRVLPRILPGTARVLRVVLYSIVAIDAFERHCRAAKVGDARHGMRMDRWIQVV